MNDIYFQKVNLLISYLKKNKNSKFLSLKLKDLVQWYKLCLFFNVCLTMVFGGGVSISTVTLANRHYLFFLSSIFTSYHFITINSINFIFRFLLSQIKHNLFITTSFFQSDGKTPLNYKKKIKRWPLELFFLNKFQAKFSF